MPLGSAASMTGHRDACVNTRKDANSHRYLQATPMCCTPTSATHSRGGEREEREHGQMQRSSVSPQGLTNVLDLEELFTNTQNFIASQERIEGNGDDEHVCRGKGRSCFPVDLVISPPSILNRFCSSIA